jgi:hypothetical protein
MFIEVFPAGKEWNKMLVNVNKINTVYVYDKETLIFLSSEEAIRCKESYEDIKRKIERAQSK